MNHNIKSIRTFIGAKNYNLSRQFMAEGTKMQENANTTGGHNAKVPTGVYSIAKGRSKF